MAPASLDRPASPLRTGSDNAGSPERHSGGDASARRAASRIPDSCMTDRILILRPTALPDTADATKTQMLRDALAKAQAGLATDDLPTAKSDSAAAKALLMKVM